MVGPDRRLRDFMAGYSVVQSTYDQVHMGDD